MARPVPVGCALSAAAVSGCPVRFFGALEAGDIDALREIYAPDAVIWHNDDLIEQPVDENLKVLRGLHRVVSGLHYDITAGSPPPTACCKRATIKAAREAVTG